MDAFEDIFFSVFFLSAKVFFAERGCQVLQCVWVHLLTRKKVGEMAKAIDVADYIIRSIKVDPLKLQKLLFYTQAVSLVKHNSPAFDDAIEAWDYGPVVRDIYDNYKKYGYEDIPPSPSKPNKLSKEILECIGLVIDYYGSKSGAALINETHSEAPWQDAYKRGQNTRIPPEAIKAYYSKIYTFD